jgi:hypothetical protein
VRAFYNFPNVQRLGQRKGLIVFVRHEEALIGRISRANPAITRGGESAKPSKTCTSRGCPAKYNRDWRLMNRVRKSGAPTFMHFPRYACPRQYVTHFGVMLASKSAPPLHPKYDLVYFAAPLMPLHLLRLHYYRIISLLPSV